MKKKIIRIIAMALSGVLAAASLTKCGSGDTAALGGRVIKALHMGGTTTYVRDG